MPMTPRRRRRLRRPALVASQALFGAALLAGCGAAVAPSGDATGGDEGPDATPPEAPHASAAASLSSSWTPPLSTRGRYVVDASGNRFRLRSGNWHGASGTWTGGGDVNDPANHHQGEMASQTPLGLDRAPMGAIVASFLELGINSIRLPFSNQMIHDGSPVSNASVAANPQLYGKTPLQIYDAAVTALTGAGLAVILNNHTNTSRWCCGIDGNERWNASQADAQWQNDWVFMAQRYRNNPRVVGADLYNEVRRNIFDDPNWGQGNGHDWQRASQLAADRILAEANPDLLIIVEGINWFGLPVDGLPHGRPTLEPVQTLSHALVRSHKLVYSAHVYGYTGPNHSGATGLGETHDPRYRDFDRAGLFEVLDRQAGYVASTLDRHFTAPVWFSEFGAQGRGQGDQREVDWFKNFVDYLIARDADFAYWPLVGFHQNRSGNNWALLHWDAQGTRAGLFDGDDWRAEPWSRLLDAVGQAGAVAPSPEWSMLTLDHADFIQSLRLRAEPDWDIGARKASCPDGQRLAGLSHTGNRGLCTDAGLANPWAPGGAYRVVRDEAHVDTDWASGYTKLQCPRDHLLIGYAVRGAAVSSALCAAAPVALGTSGRTVWFDRGDNRPAGGRGGEFAYGHYKGQCEDNEYIAGIAYTGRFGSSKTPDALFCRKIH